ncbi:MAG TPA: putative Na+/H+ antiporter, partial [Chlamydiales bacterium]|nr:putative Na+/H+ antiporter [Chlamydiales bacterium]
EKYGLNANSIVKAAEKAMSRVAKTLGGSVSAWWFSILTIGPLLGSFITEAGAMTLAALLLGRQIYQYKPNPKLAYATIGLLFVNISVGGVLTNFAAPPVLIVAKCWGWSSWYMFSVFGWKAFAGIVLCNTAGWFIFKKELRSLQRSKAQMQGHTPVDEDTEPVPVWITITHFVLLFWIVLNSHYPPVFIGSFLLFLGFHHATAPHQFALSLKRPILVGFFLAGLVIHGGLQGWWIEPSLGGLSRGALMLTGVILTAFNDNAAVVYLASLLPTLTESLKYAIMSGVIIGGGLTVIANAPNPAGQMILRKYFRGGVSPLYLFLGALGPTLVFLAIFFFTMR